MTEEKAKVRGGREPTHQELTAEVKRLNEIVTRGVNSQNAQSAKGLDLGDIHEHVSWRDIQDMKPNNLKRREK